jgi:hypothetical protein
VMSESLKYPVQEARSAIGDLLISLPPVDSRSWRRVRTTTRIDFKSQSCQFHKGKAASLSGQETTASASDNRRGLASRIARLVLPW